MKFRVIINLKDNTEILLIIYYTLGWPIAIGDFSKVVILLLPPPILF